MNFDSFIQNKSHCVYSHIVGLKSQVEKLTQAVEQLRMTQVAMVRNRLGSQSTSDMGAIYEYSSARSLSSSVHSMSPPTSTMMMWNAAKHENWKMPFTFKCIGTFRYVHLYDANL